MNLSRCRLKLEQASPSVKNKLDSIVTRLDGLCSDDSDDALLDEDRREQWEKLFQYALIESAYPMITLTLS